MSMSAHEPPTFGCTWWVYMVLTSRNTLYTGIATDPERRFAEHLAVAQGHKRARGAKYFRTVTPLNLVYTEACASRSEATRRERAIKRMRPADKARLVALVER